MILVHCQYFRWTLYLARNGFVRILSVILQQKQHLQKNKSLNLGFVMIQSFNVETALKEV